MQRPEKGPLRPTTEEAGGFTKRVPNLAAWHSTHPRATLAEIEVAVEEQKDKAQIVEEALQLREELMGRDYSDMIQAALAVRFSDSPEHRLEAIESLRDEVQGATPDGSVSVSAAIARIRARRLQPS
jgi:hypothetical protein